MRLISTFAATALLAAPATAVASPDDPPSDELDDSRQAPYQGPQQDSQQAEPLQSPDDESPDEPRLGIMVIELTPELRKHFGAPRDGGLLVAQILPGSPAERAEIRIGDVVVRLGHNKVQTARDLLNVLDSMSQRGTGRTIPVDVIRNRKQVTVRTMIGRGAQDESPPMWTPA